MSKLYLNVNDQIDHLVNKKKLIINDVDYARRKLSEITCFSLIGGYKSPFINPETRIYKDNSTFENILSLYQFDKALRSLTFDALSTVEEKLHQQISDAFCSRFGENQSAFLDSNNYSKNPRDARTVNKLITKHLQNAVNDTEHKYIAHQREKHNNVPLWVAIKVLTFGNISRMYSVLQFHQRQKIANGFGNISERKLARTIDCMTYFRNVCAHGERLYSFKLNQRTFPDTVLHQKLGIPMKGSEYSLGKKDYFGLVIGLRYLMPSDEFLTYKRKLKLLIDSFIRKKSRITRDDLLSMMGFPHNWESLTRYKM